jgi:fructose-bisphosphate aldolase class II
MNVIEAIHCKIPNTHLVMHGSSSVPQELQDIINENGGEMAQTYGVPVEEIVRGIKARRAQGQHRHRQPHGDDRPVPQGGDRRRPSEFDPRKFLIPAMDEMEKLVLRPLRGFRHRRHRLRRSRVIAMDDMAAALCVSGALDPQTTTAQGCLRNRFKLLYGEIQEERSTP